MRFLGIILVIFLLSTPAFGDSVIESLEKAKTLYKQGKYYKAVTELNFAIGLIQDKQLDRFKSLFPEAPAGWNAGQVEGSRAPGNIMGGGITVSRDYSSGDHQRIRIEMITDSPLLSSVMMLLSNPMIMGGGRLVSINGEKGIEEWNTQDKSGKIQIVLQNRMLITISGSGLKSKDILYDFAKKLDFTKIKKAMEE